MIQNTYRLQGVQTPVKVIKLTLSLVGNVFLCSFGVSTLRIVPVKHASRVSIVTMSTGELDTGNRKFWNVLFSVGFPWTGVERSLSSLGRSIESLPFVVTLGSGLVVEESTDEAPTDSVAPIPMKSWGGCFFHQSASSGTVRTEAGGMWNSPRKTKEGTNIAYVYSHTNYDIYAHMYGLQYCYRTVN